MPNETTQQRIARIRNSSSQNNAQQGETTLERINRVRESQSKVRTDSTQKSKKPEKDVKGGFLGELVSGNTQRFGKTIGESLAAPKNADMFSESLQQYTDLENQLVTKIKEQETLGGDTTKLQEVLKQHQASKPEVEQFTGDVINKTNKQVAGEAIGTGLEALSGGVLTKGINAVTKPATFGSKLLNLGKTGAQYGAVAGLSQGMQEDKNFGGIVGDTAKGAGVGALFGVGGGLIGKGLSKVTSKKPNAKKIAGQLLKPQTERDANIAVKIGRELDANNIKTYADNTKAAQGYIDELQTYKDKILSRNTRAIPIEELSIVTGTGDNAVKVNYVTEGLSDLYKHFDSINDLASKKRILNLAQKAETKGLTRLEIEKIAREHGAKINAFNANGKSAAGLTKQRAENTRKGIKATSRGLTNNPEVSKRLKEVDDQISKALTYKKLSEKMEKEVAKFTNDRVKMGILSRISSAGANLANMLLGGAPSSVFKSLAYGISPSRAATRKLSPLELQLALNKNLKLLQQLNKTNDPTKLEKILKTLTKNVVFER